MDMQKIKDNAKVRKVRLNNNLNKEIIVRVKNKPTMTKGTKTTKTTTYEIKTSAIKEEFNNQYGINIDSSLKGILDPEEKVFAKVSIVNGLRKYAKDNTAKFL